MNDRVRDLLIVAGVVGLIWFLTRQADKPPVCPGPDCPVRPIPVPIPVPDRPRPRPWGDRSPASVEAEPGKPVEGGKVSPDGKAEITCDLPVEQKFKNRGGTDGAGLCVFASITWAARFQNERRLVNLFNDMLKERGGGYPEKVTAMIEKYGKGTQYVQHTGGDIEFLKAAIRSGRMCCVTYNGHDPHYSGSIAHMVCLVHIDDQWACISDNNAIGDNQFVWMSVAEFKQRWMGNSGGWVVVLLSPPPPPPPHN